MNSSRFYATAMFLISKPSDDQVQVFLHERDADRFSYPEVGGTSQASLPAAYNVDHNRIQLGAGDRDFDLSKAALRAWAMFKVPGLELVPSDTPIMSGQNVAILARHLGFYSLSSCRIVYVIDEPDRFGFAYGTLSEHVEIGEERFTVEYDRATGKVWYDILAFSRPGHFLVKLGYPYARYLQKQFAVGSKAAMVRAVDNLRA